MENYFVTTHFGGVNPNTTQLHTEIESNINITKVLQGINHTENNVDIVFDISLSAPEKTELDGVVSSHVPVFEIALENEIIINIEKHSKKSSFRKIATYIFPGATYAKAKSVSYMNSDATSYDILIFDKDNKQILLQSNLTNTTESIQELGELSNLSSEMIRVEISIRRNGGNSSTKVYIESIIICFNK